MKDKASVFFILILCFVWTNFTLAQFGLSPVPVSDSGASSLLGAINAMLEKNARTLDEIMTVMAEAYQPLVTNISNILLNQIQDEQSDKIFSPAINNLAYYIYDWQIQDLLKVRKITDKDTSNIEAGTPISDAEGNIDNNVWYYQALVEAEKAGVYKAIENLPNVIDCIPFEVEEDLIDELNTELYYSGYFFQEKLNEVFNFIPRCSVAPLAVKEKSQNLTRKNKSILTSIFRPFNLGLLAQISVDSNPSLTSQGSFLANTSIPTAFNEIVINQSLSSLKTGISSYFKQSAEEERKKRESSIGEYRPVEECTKITFDDTFEPVCLKYEPKVDLTRLALEKRFQPNFNQIIEETFYLPATSTLIKKAEEIAYRLNLATSLPPLEEIMPDFKDLAEEICSKYKPLSTSTEDVASTSERTTNFVNYQKCLDTLRKNQERINRVLRATLEDLLNKASTTKAKIDNIKVKIDELSEILNRCPSTAGVTFRTLYFTSDWLEKIKTRYNFYYSDYRSFDLRNFQELAMKVERFKDNIDRLNRDLEFLKSAGIYGGGSIEVLIPGLSEKKIRNLRGYTEGLLRNILPSEIIGFISKVQEAISKIQEVLNSQAVQDFLNIARQGRLDVSTRIRATVELIYVINDEIKEIRKEMLKYLQAFKKENLSFGEILSIDYDLDATLALIEAYKKYAESQGCTTTIIKAIPKNMWAQNINKNLNKKIVVKSPVLTKTQKKQTWLQRITKINPFYSFANIFQPKLVEFKFSQ